MVSLDRVQLMTSSFPTSSSLEQKASAALWGPLKLGSLSALLCAYRASSAVMQTTRFEPIRTEGAWSFIKSNCVTTASDWNRPPLHLRPDLCTPSVKCNWVSGGNADTRVAPLPATLNEAEGLGAHITKYVVKSGMQSRSKPRLK